MNRISPFPAFHSARRPAMALAFLCLTAPTALHAAWNRAAAGTYEYTSSANWSSGVIDGTFSNALTGGQQITFDKDWALTSNGLRFTYTSAYNIVFRSNSSTARTISFADANTIIGISSNGQGDGTLMRTVTFGTADQPLIFDLGAGARTHTIRPGENTTFVVNAKLTGGNADGWLVIQGKTSATPGYISLTNDTSDFISNLQVTAARPLIISSVADAGVASAIGAGSIVRFSNGSRADIQYTGGAASTNRTFQIESQPVNIYNEGTGKLTFSGAFTRSASTNSEVRFAGAGDIEVSGTIGDSAGSGAMAVSKTGEGILTLSGTDNSFSGGIDASGNWVDFVSVGNSGVNSSLGSAGSIRVGNVGSPTFANVGKLRYIGTTDASTDREVLLNEAVIHNDGTGTLSFTGVVTTMGNGDRSLTLGGSNKGLNRITGDISDGSGDAAVRSVVKEGEGLWALEGDNSYTGTTDIREGILLINGAHSGTGALTVSDGAAIGGSGSVAGDLIVDAGGFFVFNASGPLNVTGEVWLDSSFGVHSLLGLDASVEHGLYTLITGSSTDFSQLGISNWGFENAYDLGGGKFAYFQEGSLQLVVIPEPGTVTLLGLSALLLGGGVYRRRCRLTASHSA